MLYSSCTFGNFRLYSIETGRFKLDGGAMFGVVPKTLWSNKIPADDKNRITMATRCLLVESTETGCFYLIDNGVGTKFNDKMASIYGLDFTHSNLLDSLSHYGFTPEDVSDIIFTHLHFDHCGGTTYWEDGQIKHQFPNATYHVTRQHWETAINPNDREKASFLKENIEPLKKSNRLNLVENGYLYEEGLTHYVINGHSLGQQLPIINGDNKTMIFMADLIPTAAHIPIPWVMGYDMRPIETLKEKKDFLVESAEEEWVLFMEHDASNELITIKEESGKYLIDSAFTLNDLDR